MGLCFFFEIYTLNINLYTFFKLSKGLLKYAVVLLLMEPEIRMLREIRISL